MIDAGASLLGVDAAACKTEGGQVVAGDQKMSFADIVAKGDISRTFTAEDLGAMPIKSAADRRLIGRDASALDVPAKSKGEAVYGLDVELPGMVYAHPLMPPTRYGSKIVSIDDNEAKDIPGYLQTLEINDPSDTIQGWAVVIADSFPSAMNAASAVNVDWEAGPTAEVSEAEGLEFLKNSKRIPCRFCGWSTPAFRTTKGGKTTGPNAAFQRLRDHVWIHHDEEHEAVMAFCTTAEDRGEVSG